SDLLAKLNALLDQIVRTHVTQFFSFHVRALAVPQTSSEWTVCAQPGGTPLERAARRHLPFRTICALAESLPPTSPERPFPCPYESPRAFWSTACRKRSKPRPYPRA